MHEFYPRLGGFEDHHRSAVIVEPYVPVAWLRLVHDEAVTFPLLEPSGFCRGYGFELRAADTEALGLGGPAEELVRCVLTVRTAAE